MAIGMPMRAILDDAVTRSGVRKDWPLLSAPLPPAHCCWLFSMICRGLKGCTDLSAFRQTNHCRYFTVGFTLVTRTLMLAYLIVERAGIQSKANLDRPDHDYFLHSEVAMRC